MKKLDAFTILELIVILAIMSILFMFLTFRLNLKEKFEEDKEIKILINDIKTIRNLSIKNKASSYIYIDKYNNKYTVKSFDYIKEVKLNYLKILSYSGKDSNIDFNRNGVSLNPKTIYLKSKNYNYEISISVATSKINLKKERKWKRQEDLHI